MKTQIKNGLLSRISKISNDLNVKFNCQSTKDYLLIGVIGHEGSFKVDSTVNNNSIIKSIHNLIK